ncbi:hypothetical protein NST02_23440 [Robertmurraya sp. FSL W8-0741]|uniref:hypothetical protein n=1 Tax=Robertmurraya sp. FSL W8-0741 TaxID=2954629 RepID=UPI0030FAF11F
MKKRILVTDTILRTILRSLPLPFASGEPILDLLDELKRSRNSIDQKIQKVHESLHETSTVIKELESELTTRTENLKILQSEYERYSTLNEIEEEKANALLSQVEHSLGKDKKSERWISFLISTVSGLLIFLAGLLLSPILTPFISKMFNFNP